MSDFPAKPTVPVEGSPTYKEPAQVDSRANHPSLDNTGPTAKVDWDKDVPFQIAAENVAEMNGVSLAEAKRLITNGCDDQSQWAQSRSETALGEAAWKKWQSPGD